MKAAVLFENEMKNSICIEVSGKITLAQYVADIWKDDAASRLAPKTFHSYCAELERRILPIMGRDRMDKISPVRVRQFVQQIREEGRKDGKPGPLSDRTVQYYFAILRTILQDAEDMGVIRDNPCKRVKRPTATKASVKVYNKVEGALLLANLDNEPLKIQALILLAIDSGAREGEIMGIEWSDIDFDTRRLDIQRQSQYVPGSGTLTKDLKNDKKMRPIRLSQPVIDILKAYRHEWLEWRLSVGNLWQGSNRVFSTPMGADGSPDWPYKKLKDLQERYELPQCSFHSLRHLSITMQLKAHVPIQEVARRAGHALPSTTLNSYAEVIESIEDEASHAMGNVISSKFGSQLVHKKYEKA